MEFLKLIQLLFVFQMSHNIVINQRGVVTGSKWNHDRPLTHRRWNRDVVSPLRNHSGGKGICIEECVKMTVMFFPYFLVDHD